MTNKCSFCNLENKKGNHLSYKDCLDATMKELARVVMGVARAVCSDDYLAQALVDDGPDAVIEAVSWLSCLVENSRILEGKEQP